MENSGKMNSKSINIKENKPSSTNDVTKPDSAGNREASPRFLRMQFTAAVFVLMLIVVLISYKNVSYDSHERILGPIQYGTSLTPAAQWSAECLIIYEDGDEMGEKGCTAMEEILSQMKVGYNTVICEDFDKAQLESYDKAVLSVTDLSLLGERVLDILDWVRVGGKLMVLYPPETNSMFTLIAPELGIEFCGSLTEVDTLHFHEGFMIGGTAHDFPLTDPFDSSLAVTLKDECRVLLDSGGEKPTPIIWTYDLMDGRVVMDNLGFIEKAYRGIHGAAFSLLDDAFAYPVINAAAFYIDDFPSPVPDGEGKYITRDYGRDIDTFYTMVWWENIRDFAEKYGVRYTGLVIEQYSDDVEAPFQPNLDITRFQYFGNLLLDSGGEIGFHGYNHMPLCLLNFDFEGQYDAYKRWASYDDMKAGLSELSRFCAGLFPGEEFHVYVPPSNILSDEGRKMLAEDFPDIKAIASVYLEGDLAYTQEFCVAEDGIIETPRVIAGYIMDDYTLLAALCELNFHFVSSHFQHPDDVLDEDRGAALGWAKMYENISGYMDWLYSSADIRSLTGLETAYAVERYDALTLTCETDEVGLKLSLGGFYDEAWLLVRINEGTPGKVDGGELTEQCPGLYLLRADEPVVHIEIVK